jgi:hypothetical protein
MIDDDLLPGWVCVFNALENPPIAPWLCRCGEHIEPQFDICWKCGKDKN